MFKHKNCIIQTTPSEKFPHMVTITKTPKVRAELLDRRYITLEKAFQAIELLESERLISSKEKYVHSELSDIVVLKETDLIFE
jgi:hypothetical protein